MTETINEDAVRSFASIEQAKFGSDVVRGLLREIDDLREQISLAKQNCGIADYARKRAEANYARDEPKACTCGPHNITADTYDHVPGCPARERAWTKT